MLKWQRLVTFPAATYSPSAPPLQDFNKTYVTEGEELRRFAVWEANKKYVDEHNSKQSEFLLEMNKFADLVRN